MRRSCTSITSSRARWRSEVFGGLVLLKFAVFGARMFRRKAQHDAQRSPRRRRCT
jgi:hypothetical protein